jgi:hypothetical protein
VAEFVHEHDDSQQNQQADDVVRGSGQKVHILELKFLVCR